jgi:toxin ParE1/3/4
MKRSLWFSKEASEDLDQIWKYHALLVSADLADRLLAQIDHILRRKIAVLPALGRSRPELGRDIRSYVIAPYVVFYRHRGSRVLVERVLHGARDIREPLMSLLAVV